MTDEMAKVVVQELIELRAEMLERFARWDAYFDRMDAHFDRIEEDLRETLRILRAE